MKKIKITVGLISEMTPMFMGLENNMTIPFPIKRKLIRFNEKLVSEFEIARKEIVKIIEAYADKDENSKPIYTENGYVFPKDKVQEINALMWEIEKEEVEIEYDEFVLNESLFENFNCSAKLVKFIESNLL